MQHISEKTLRLVGYVEQEPGILPAELAQKMQLSVRAVRNEVNAANDALADAAQIVLKRGQGYHLEIADGTAWKSWQDAASRRSGLPTIPEERQAFLLNVLLERSDFVTLDDLAQELYVSRATI